MRKIAATDLKIWQRIGISQCPIEVLEFIIAKCLNPLNDKLALKIERIATVGKESDILNQPTVENILETILTLKETGYTQIAVWMRIEPKTDLEKFKSRLADAGYDLDIQPSKFDTPS